MKMQADRIEILNFEKFGDIPHTIRKSVRNFHYHKKHDWCTSHIDNAIKHETIKGCHVLMVDGVPVGWYTRFNYVNKIRWYEDVAKIDKLEFGFWVAHKYRGNGFGRILFAHSVEHYAGKKTEYFKTAGDFRIDIGDVARKTKVKMTKLARNILIESKVSVP